MKKNSIITPLLVSKRKTVDELINDGKSFNEINEYFQKYDEIIESEIKNYGLCYTEK